MACFMERGTTPDVIDELIRCVRKGARSSAMCFSSHIGTGSSPQDVDGDLSIRLSADKCQTPMWLGMCAAVVRSNCAGSQD